MKNVQIPLTLFLELYGYVLLGNYQFHDDIVRQLEDKHRKVYNHLLYSTSKTAKSEEEREEARQKCLDEVGMKDSYRYSLSDYDSCVAHSC